MTNLPSDPRRICEWLQNEARFCLSMAGQEYMPPANRESWASRAEWLAQANQCIVELCEVAAAVG